MSKNNPLHKMSILSFRMLPALIIFLLLSEGINQIKRFPKKRIIFISTEL